MKSLREHSKARSNAKIAKYMKGGSASNCYASGGTVKATAAKNREDMPPVEGKAARPRLDRPGRRMKRAEGGSTISRDSRDEASRLRREYDINNEEANRRVFRSSVPAGAGTAMLLGARSLPGKLIGAGLTGVGVANLPSVFEGTTAQNNRRLEIDRIERGQAEPGKEDRKKGGRVKK